MHNPATLFEPRRGCALGGVSFRCFATRDGTRTEHLGNRSSYTYQLETFTTAVRAGVPARTDAADALKTMRLIDQCYEAVGMARRPS